MQTLCAFLNGSGGTLLFGVRPDGTPEGQPTSDQTLREIVAASERFEPRPEVRIEDVTVADGRTVIILDVADDPEAGPFTYDGRPYERMETTTRRMRQFAYERRLLDRVHATHRWENYPTEGVTLRDLDRDQVDRVVETARSAGRVMAPVGRNIGEVLDRLGVRQDGRILQAAIVLFGRKFLPYYPQCLLQLARFRGTDKTEFLDQKEFQAPALQLLDEAEIFCWRHFPLPGKIVPGKMERQDRPLIPPDALREILVNALIHRDYSIAGGSVDVGIFDDRVEIWSTGTFPTGIRPAMLTRRHPSVRRNPIIAGVFHRMGLIEKWGRGTNRVAEMCRSAGMRPPVFEEIGPSALVTFRVPVAGAARGMERAEGPILVPARDQVGTKSAPSGGPPAMPGPPNGA